MTKWVQTVKRTRARFPKGFFLQEPKPLARALMRRSASYKQAMARLNFYINRGLKGRCPFENSRLEAAKHELERLKPASNMSCGRRNLSTGHGLTAKQHKQHAKDDMKRSKAAAGYGDRHGAKAFALSAKWHLAQARMIARS